MFTVLVDEERAGISSRELLRELDSRKIQARPLWQPMHCSPAHDAKASPASPQAEKLHRQAISLPCSVGLTTAAQDYVIETVTAILSQRKLLAGVR
jgi:perosamine synthetase